MKKYPELNLVELNKRKLALKSALIVLVILGLVFVFTLVLLKAKFYFIYSGNGAVYRLDRYLFL
ncbi:hypothetical protein CA265_00335 [Sphingobacteriaceae bacterium GW460-11-11-14-LB5]|nr:hypothetical protein CA265_00335 [Sphingobacteriaceae bacterium GW460-11-11-14-LB5]